MCDVTIIDAPCGAGKTSFAIEYMNKELFERFIYITPFISELDRVINACDNRDFTQPNKIIGKGSKKNHFYELLKEGDNITSTHSLFRSISCDIINTIKEMEYILILDEVCDVVENIDISKYDLNMLLNTNTIDVNDDNKVIWVNENYVGKFSYLKDSIKNGDVYLYNESMILWTFPINIFKAFKHVYVMTYLFKAQIQAYYYDLNNLKYEYKSVENIDGKYKLIDYKEINGEKYKNLINIYEGNLNEIGNNKFALSKTWYNKANKKELMKTLNNNIVNYFKNIVKGKSKLNMWTTFQDYQTTLQGKGYTKGFVSCNARATNDFKEKTNLAYLCNRYYNPIIKQFFIDKKVTINEDIWALSELIQWMFRSAIRENKPINIYIPSERMRRLLQEWLGINQQD